MLKNLAKHQQPREKLLERGADNLTDAELLALILGSGTKRHNVMKLSQQLIRKFPYNSDQLYSITELTTLNGIGSVRASTIIAIHALISRWSEPQLLSPVITPADVLTEVGSIRFSMQEQLVALYINARSQLIHKQVIAIGQLNTLAIEPRELFRPAFEKPCVGLIIVHNHPSNNPEPSKDDKVFTLKMQQAGKLLGIEVIDHVIVTRTSYFSFRENALL